MLRLGSRCAHPDSLVDTLKGIGWNRLPAAGFEFRRVIWRESGADRALFRASPRIPHPNRSVWQWVEIGPVRRIGAGKSVLRGILRDFSGV